MLDDLPCECGRRLKNSRPGGKTGREKQNFRDFYIFAWSGPAVRVSYLTGLSWSGKAGIQTDVENVKQDSHQRVDDKCIAGNFHLFPAAIFADHNNQDGGAKLGQ